MLCRQLLREQEQGICSKCRNQEAFRVISTEWKIPHVRCWTAMWQYSGDVRHSLILYKFWRRRLYARVYAAELTEHLKRWDEKYDLITWVPISGLRKWRRGYDQVELIARAMTTEVPVVHAIRKCRHNRRQSSILGRKARLQNVKGVYVCRTPEQVRGKRVLLIDDIVTTGATVSEAAKVLRQAGAKSVFVACVATPSFYA